MAAIPPSRRREVLTGKRATLITPATASEPNEKYCRELDMTIFGSGLTRAVTGGVQKITIKMHNSIFIKATDIYVKLVGPEEALTSIDDVVVETLPGKGFHLYYNVFMPGNYKLILSIENYVFPTFNIVAHATANLGSALRQSMKFFIKMLRKCDVEKNNLYHVNRRFNSYFTTLAYKGTNLVSASKQIEHVSQILQKNLPFSLFKEYNENRKKATSSQTQTKNSDLRHAQRNWIARQQTTRNADEIPNIPQTLQAESSLVPGKYVLKEYILPRNQTSIYLRNIKPGEAHLIKVGDNDDKDEQISTAVQTDVTGQARARRHPRLRVNRVIYEDELEEPVNHVPINENIEHDQAGPSQAGPSDQAGPSQAGPSQARRSDQAGPIPDTQPDASDDDYNKCGTSGYVPPSQTKTVKITEETKSISNVKSESKENRKRKILHKEGEQNNGHDSNRLVAAQQMNNTVNITECSAKRAKTSASDVSMAVLSGVDSEVINLEKEPAPKPAQLAYLAAIKRMKRRAEEAELDKEVVKKKIKIGHDLQLSRTKSVAKDCFKTPESSSNMADYEKNSVTPMDQSDKTTANNLTVTTTTQPIIVCVSPNTSTKCGRRKTKSRNPITKSPNKSQQVTQQRRLNSNTMADETAMDQTEDPESDSDSPIKRRRVSSETVSSSNSDYRKTQTQPLIQQRRSNSRYSLRKLKRVDYTEEEDEWD